MTSISPRQLHERLEPGVNLPLLDVRTPAEFAESHVHGAQLMPLNRLNGDELAEVQGFARDRPLYIFCGSGTRAKQAAEKLKSDGYEQCCVVEGGITAWTRGGLPVDYGSRNTMSLERQVRVAAGTIVLTGVLFAQFVNPVFMWLSGFIGAGLVFAGITDWCGMGMLIARMPWNQNGSASCDVRK